MLAFFEREVAGARVGADNGNGLVARVDVVGVAATTHDHYDSRAGDPQLHTDVVVSNKARTGADLKWRTLEQVDKRWILTKRALLLTRIQEEGLLHG